LPITAENRLGLPLFQFGILQSQAGLAHAIATRHAPSRPLFPEVQPAQPDDYRTAGPARFHRKEIIAGRRSEMLAALGFDWRVVQPNLVGVRQIHSATVRAVGTEAYGAELNWLQPIADADGLVTNCPGVPMMTIHADCPPIILYDPVKNAAGVLHSGWRGTVGKIAAAGVRAMTENYGCRPADILAGVGPSIGACCYQVGEPVLSEVKAAFGAAVAADLLMMRPDGSFHFDLGQAIYQTLRESGVTAAHIEQSGICTLCHNRNFFSYRGTPADRREDYGQFTALVVLR
jgi:polyphenol oxidase